MFRQRDDGVAVERIAALAIVEHPERCGWTFEHRPPGAAPPRPRAQPQRRCSLPFGYCVLKIKGRPSAAAASQAASILRGWLV